MKRFFPSSVMLTPFVVKHYQEQEDAQDVDEEQNENEQTIQQQEATIEPS
ncbi:hypothetical protein QWZ04_16340 [Vibrio tapetis subsp. quintayensis]|nr:hypothetical protein [Vibrio tapetis]MDN3681876.1 hypothetical protein [Vibrio tapetis subsp. quintayensis]